MGVKVLLLLYPIQNVTGKCCEDDESNLKHI